MPRAARLQLITIRTGRQHHRQIGRLLAVEDVTDGPSCVSCCLQYPFSFVILALRSVKAIATQHDEPNCRVRSPSSELPQLDKERRQGVRSFLPGKLLGTHAALLSLMLLVLGFAILVDKD